jgi:hypothetical protein
MRIVGVILLSIGFSGVLSGCASAAPVAAADDTVLRTLPRPREGSSFGGSSSNGQARSLTRQEYARALAEQKERDRERFLIRQGCASATGCEN